MNGNKIKPKSNNLDLRYLIFMGIAAVIGIAWAMLDSEGRLIGYAITLWNKFTLSLKQNWLIYLVGLLIVKLMISVLENILRKRKTGESEIYNLPSKTSPDTYGDVPAKGKKNIDRLTAILENIGIFLVLIIMVYLVIVSIFINPVGWVINYLDMSLSGTVRNLLPLLNGICGFAGVIVTFLLSFVIKDYFSKVSIASRKRPKFFDEMQSTLRSILIPLGFKETVGTYNQRQKDVRFLRDRLSVLLWADDWDGDYGIGTSSNYEHDFSMTGTILEADKFKTESIAKLEEWLVKGEVK